MERDKSQKPAKAPDQERPQRRGRSWGRHTWSVPGAPGTLDDVDLQFAHAIKFCFMKPNAPRRPHWPGQTAPARGATEAVSGGVSKWGVAAGWTTRRPENLFHSPERVMTLKASYGVCRMPGFKYPTTEANVRRAIIFRSGGVFVGSVCRQSPACGAALVGALHSLPARGLKPA